jgi:hypothetical protein
MTDIEDYPETTAGPANDETTVVPPVTVAAHKLAWSADTAVIESERQSWGEAWSAAAIMVLCCAVVALAIWGVALLRSGSDGGAHEAMRPTVTATAYPTPTMAAAALPPITPAPTSTVTVAAQAPTPAFSGRYAVTETAPDGRSVTNAWEITPCGDGCVKVTPVGRPDVGPDAHLINGQWVFDNTLTAFCADGSSVPSAGRGHFTIDAITLRGTLKSVWTKDSCGQPPGDTTHSLVLTKVNV